MALSRAELLAYAEEEFKELAALTGITTGDSAAGHKYPLDSTFRKLGVAHGYLDIGEVEEGKEEDAFLLLDYYELQRIAKKLSAIRDANPSPGAVSFRQSTQLAQVERRLNDAKERLEALGYNVAGGGQFEMGSILLDRLEPAGNW